MKTIKVNNIDLSSQAAYYSKKIFIEKTETVKNLF